MKNSMLKAEWRQLLKTRKLAIPMIAILFIPVLYAGMFLWAFWDPYANMADLPVAVVNADKGADFEGEKLTLGQELSDTLIEDGTFKFMDVSKEKAEKGLRNQEYYVVIEIPENFSEHATTLLDENPEKLTMIYKPNEGYNFLSAQIGETAMDRIRAEVNEKVAATYAEQLFNTIAKMGDGFGDAADGAGKIHDGTLKLQEGADELKGHLETLANRTVTLTDGTNDLANGAKEAGTGANELSKGLGELENGAAKLLAGAQEASGGATELQKGVEVYTGNVQKLTDSYREIGEKENAFNGAVHTLTDKTKELTAATGQLAVGAKDLQAGVDNFTAQLAPILSTLPEEQQVALNAALGQLKKGSTSLSTGLQGLTSGTSSLSEGAKELSTASNQLTDAQQQAFEGLTGLTNAAPKLQKGVTALANGNGELADGLAQLSGGISTAQNGSESLATGLQALTEGTNTLNDGTGTLAAKSKELADGSGLLIEGTQELDAGVFTLQEKLAEANGEASDVNPSEKTYEMAASPVDIEQDGINHVPNYGTGFAPYFLSLGLFVGALLLSIVFPLVEPALKPTGPFAWFMSKVSVLAIVGLIQALIAVVIVKFGLGMETTNTALFIVATVLTSYTFIALVQMLVSILGDPGRFMAILILILQLTTSAGTFPLELIPSSLQVFNVLLPMTYSVSAFKAAISTGDLSFFWSNSSVLIGFMVACLVITCGYFVFVFKGTHARHDSKQLYGCES